MLDDAIVQPQCAGMNPEALSAKHLQRNPSERRMLAWPGRHWLWVGLQFGAKCLGLKVWELRSKNLSGVRTSLYYEHLTL